VDNFLTETSNKISRESPETILCKPVGERSEHMSSPGCYKRIAKYSLKQRIILPVLTLAFLTPLGCASVNSTTKDNISRKNL